VDGDAVRAAGAIVEEASEELRGAARPAR
jgi:hypothetical protein